MKHFLLLISLFIFSHSYAQNKLAIRGGYNYSTAKVRFNGAELKSSYKSGVNLGLQAKIAFEPPLYFTPFISYSLRGYTFENGIGDTTKTDVTLHYIDLAPILGYDIKTGANSHLTISAGPLAGLAFKGKEKLTVNGNASSKDIKFSVSGSYGYYDLAVYSSIGYHFGKFFVEGSYQHGFVSINNEEEFDGRNIQNRLFSINLGYFIK